MMNQLIARPTYSEKEVHFLTHTRTYTTRTYLRHELLPKVQGPFDFVIDHELKEAVFDMRYSKFKQKAIIKKIIATQGEEVAQRLYRQQGRSPRCRAIHIQTEGEKFRYPSYIWKHPAIKSILKLQRISENFRTPIGVLREYREFLSRFEQSPDPFQGLDRDCNVFETYFANVLMLNLRHNILRRFLSPEKKVLHFSYEEPIWGKEKFLFTHERVQLFFEINYIVIREPILNLLREHLLEDDFVKGSITMNSFYVALKFLFDKLAEVSNCESFDEWTREKAKYLLDTVDDSYLETLQKPLDKKGLYSDQNSP